MGHHRPSEAGIFDFADNVKACKELGDKIVKKAAAIRQRSLNGDHEVGNGNFITLENLRHKRRQAFTRILEGLGIIVVAAGAAATIIIASDGCGKSASQDEVSSTCVLPDRD